MRKKCVHVCVCSGFFYFRSDTNQKHSYWRYIIFKSLYLCFQYNSKKIVYEAQQYNEQKTPNISPTMASSSIYLYMYIQMYVYTAQHIYKCVWYTSNTNEMLPTTFSCYFCLYLTKTDTQKFISIYCVYQNIKKMGKILQFSQNSKKNSKLIAQKNW